LRPLAVTISFGAGNSYGLPHRETLDAAARSGAVVLRTDRHGVIKLALDDARIEVRTERRPPPACPRPPPVL